MDKTVWVLVAHGTKYYDNVGGIKVIFYMCNEFKKRGIQCKIIVHNFIFKDIGIDNRKSVNLTDIFNDIIYLDCLNIKEDKILDHFVTNCKIKNTDIIISTLQQYTKIFENYTKNIIIYMLGGGDYFMQNYSSINHIDTKYAYPIIYYNKYWVGDIYDKISKHFSEDYFLLPYTCIDKCLIEVAKNINNIKKQVTYKCLYINKNKLHFDMIHKNDRFVLDLQNNSFQKNIENISKSKFIYLYDLDSFYVPVCLLLKTNIIIPKYQNMTKNDFIKMYKERNKLRDKYIELFEKYCIYIENISEIKILNYIDTTESNDYLFDVLINELYKNDNGESYDEINNNTVQKFIELFNDIDNKNYFRTHDLKKIMDNNS